MATNAAPLKYPRTPHLSFSPGVLDDDIVLSSEAMPYWLIEEEIIITEKLDGGNTCIHCGKVYARTTNSEATHPSFGPIKQLAAQISFMVPENIQIFGENMFGVHSIEYDQLDSYFYIFGVLEDGKNWFSWDSIVELSDMIGIPTVPEVSRRKFSSLEELRVFIEAKMKLSSHFGSNNPEGFVVRTMGGFPFDTFDKNTAKYVRSGHVQTSDNWRQTWKQAKLKRK